MPLIVVAPFLLPGQEEIAFELPEWLWGDDRLVKVTVFADGYPANPFWLRLPANKSNMKRVFLFLIFALVLSATCLAQTGQTQDAPLDSKRVGFAPTVVRHANLAAQDVTTWSGLPGQATVTTGVKAPDGTTTAATLSIVSPNTGGKLVYSARIRCKSATGCFSVFGSERFL